LVRYADDMVLLARQWTAELSAYVESRLEGKFGLEINRDKTRVVDVKKESLDFLGYTFRYDRDLKGRRKKYLNVLPSKQAVARRRGEAARDDLDQPEPHSVVAACGAAEPEPGRLGELLQLRLSAQGVVGRSTGTCEAA